MGDFELDVKNGKLCLKPLGIVEAEQKLGKEVKHARIMPEFASLIYSKPKEKKK